MSETIISGAYDMHVHSGPDIMPRKGDFIDLAHQDEDSLVNYILSKQSKNEISQQEDLSVEINKQKRRLDAVDNLLSKLYEDRIAGIINDRNFTVLSQKYQKEQDAIETKIKELTEKISQSKTERSGRDKIIDLFRKQTSIDELTHSLLNDLIEKIVVHEAIKHDGKRREQEIEIYWRFIGCL